MRVGILGASSQIGQALIEQLQSMGHDVQIWGRQRDGSESSHFYFDLDAPTPLTAPSCESAVLLSWIGDPRTPEIMQKNESGYKFLASELRKANIFPIFVSTATSSPTSRSVHARAKYEIEQVFEGWGAIVRPGRILLPDGKIVGKAARKTLLLSRIGSVIRTDLRVPIVQLEVLTAKLAVLAVLRTPGKWDIRDESIPVGSDLEFVPLIPRKILHYFVLGSTLLFFRRRSNILDRWYALLDAQGLDQDK